MADPQSTLPTEKEFPDPWDSSDTDSLHSKHSEPQGPVFPSLEQTSSNRLRSMHSDPPPNTFPAPGYYQDTPAVSGPSVVSGSLLKASTGRPTDTAQPSVAKLNDAIRWDTFALFVSLVDSGIDVNVPYEVKWHSLSDILYANPMDIIGLPIQVAARSGARLVFFRKLLDAGATVDGRCDGESSTALQLACRKGFCDIVHLLLAAGADVNAPPGRVGTALEAALQAPTKTYPEYIDVLVQRGARLEDALNDTLKHFTPGSINTRRWRPLATLHWRASTSSAYDSGEELVSEFYHANALTLLRLIRIKWQIPAALQSVEQSPRSTRDELQQAKRIENQFVLVTNIPDCSKVLGTTCGNFVLNNWGKEGMLVLRWVVRNVLECHGFKTYTDDEDFEKDFEKDWRKSALSGYLHSVSPSGKAHYDLRLGHNPPTPSMLRTILEILSFIATATTSPDIQDNTILPLPRIVRSSPRMTIRMRDEYSMDPRWPVQINIGTLESEAFGNNFYNTTTGYPTAGGSLRGSFSPPQTLRPSSSRVEDADVLGPLYSPSQALKGTQQQRHRRGVAEIRERLAEREWQDRKRQDRKWQELERQKTWERERLERERLERARERVRERERVRRELELQELERLEQERQERLEREQREWWEWWRRRRGEEDHQLKQQLDVNLNLDERRSSTGRQNSAENSKSENSFQQTEEGKSLKLNQVGSKSTEGERDCKEHTNDDTVETTRDQSGFNKLRDTNLTNTEATFDMSKCNCWRNLFHFATVALSWNENVLPVVSGKGLCISFDHMVSLAGIEYSVNIGKTVVLVGYRTALIPTQIDASFTQYHLLVSESNQINLSSFPEELKHAAEASDLSILRDRWCFVGWCGAADIILGTKEFTNSTSVRESNAKETRRTAQLSGIGISIGITSALPVQVGPTLQLSGSFVLNRARFQSLMVFSQLLRDSARQLALLYDADTNANRGWVVPKLRLLLFMCHWHIMKIAEEQINPKLFVSSSPDPNDIVRPLDSLGDLVLYGSGSDALRFRTLLTGLNMNLDSIIEKTQPSKGTSLYGFEFHDIIKAPARGAWMKKVPVGGRDGDIIQMAKLVDAVVFGAAFGDVIRQQPTTPIFANSQKRSASKCNTIPFGSNYIVTTVNSLAELATDYCGGFSMNVDSNEVELKHGICWRVSQNAFEPCLHGEDEKQTCWNREERFQHLGKPSANSTTSANGHTKITRRKLPVEGAVVFGRPSQLLEPSCWSSLF